MVQNFFFASFLLYFYSESFFRFFPFFSVAATCLLRYNNGVALDVYNSVNMHIGEYMHTHRYRHADIYTYTWMENGVAAGLAH